MTAPIIDSLRGMTESIGECLDADHAMTVAMLAAILDDERGGQMLPVFSRVDEEADVWAQQTTPIDMEAYLNAIGRRLVDTPMHIKARKRLIAGLFKKMGPEDRAAFLAWAQTQENEE